MKKICVLKSFAVFLFFILSLTLSAHAAEQEVRLIVPGCGV